MASTVLPATGDADARPRPLARDEGRLRSLIAENADFIWRSLRRFGLPPDAAEDAAQRVFLVASERLTEIAVGAEQAFLFRTAVHVASRARRAHARRREELLADPAAELPDATPGTDELLDLQRARDLLEDALDRMPMDARAVFILFELEGKAIAEIAAMLDVPVGTVGSRLRRARKDFEAFIRRVEAAEKRRRAR